MKPDELQQLLAAFAAERVALLDRHVAGARVVSHYDFNNAYQYVISREETHLQWLQAALGAAPPPASAALPVPEAPKAGKKDDTARLRTIYEDDVRQLAAFVARWRPRVEAMTDARHRKMLDVILGESREHEQLFAQAAAGNEDLLGRRTGGVARQGSVLPVRWME
ncbi:MAG: hypothetical protein HY824_15955 [Acidobacteria bacterium]|nr:hypothetical protein [Acidobacteriota bacterium]